MKRHSGHRIRHGTILGIWVGAGLLLATPTEAQEELGPPPGPEGETIERVAVRSVPDLAYAVFLPPGYRAGDQRPTLVLMDPRRQALRPLERFRIGAARHGWILLSSYDTSSDEPTSASESRRAVEAILNDAVGRFGVDLQRLYLGGFSGTARLAWTMATENPGLFAGIAGFGAGASPTALLGSFTGVAPWDGTFFGGAGQLDFNHMEVRRLDRQLDETKISHAVRYYEGGHGWPPAPVAGEALDWLELNARVRRGSGEDRAWAERRLAGAVDAAVRLEAEGRPHEAWRRLRELVGAFEGVADLSDARRRLGRLDDADRVRETREALTRWEEWERRSQERVSAALRSLDGDPIPSVEELATMVDLEALQRQERSGDTLAAQAAGRQLRLLLVLTTLYRPTVYLETGSPARAVRSLELAHRARPGWDPICDQLRRVPHPARGTSRSLQEACGTDEPAG